MSHEKILAIQLVAVLLFVAGLSYVLASIGHPTSVWLWRDILGAIE